VVRLHKAFEDDGNVYLLLQQWGGGASLAHAVAARGKLPEHEAAAHTAALLDALAHLHAQGVAHRDVKPANCLLRCQAPAAELPPARPSCVGLADLGLAAKCGPAAPARRGLCGTPNYLAPEALAGSHGREADVWALGCLAHTLMVGQPPFAAPTVPATYARIKAGDLRMPTHLSVRPSRGMLTVVLVH
jgi:serine/threonine protein kinase